MSYPVLQPFNVSVANVTKLAAEYYGLSGTATTLPGEHDANFQFVTTGGETFVLKVLHPGQDPSLVTLQIEALAHLECHMPFDYGPKVQRTTHGDLSVCVTLPDGTPTTLWMLTWVAGVPLASVTPRHGLVSERLGTALGTLTAGLQTFRHAAARREFRWDLLHADWIASHMDRVLSPSHARLVSQFLALYTREVVPLRDTLRRSIIHGDANDHNVMVRTSRAAMPTVAGLIDFGDMHESATVNEVAVGAAYALLDAGNPLAEIAHVVRGFHAQFPLTEQEMALLFPLIAMRLCVSVVNSACRTADGVGDPYATVSEQPAWEALERLAQIAPAFAQYTLRHACGLPPVPHCASVVRWLTAQAGSACSVLDIPVRPAHQVVFDLRVGSLQFGADPANLSPHAMGRVIDQVMRDTGATIGIGRYDEPRAVYMVPAFALGRLPTDERRTVHMGVDLFAAAGVGVCAPLDATVHAFANLANPQDYGPVIILRHETGDGVPFYSLYGHLSVTSLASLHVGDTIAAGERFAWLGDVHENGGWAPHLHFQLITDLLGLDTAFPGVIPQSARDVWRDLSPNPCALLGVRNATTPSPPPIHEIRQKHIGGSVKLSYDVPLTIVRGWQQYLYDDTGRAYLDVYNNVPLVGHSHPRVVHAVQQQMALLNTNTRYLHENMVAYGERLSALMPAALSVCFIVNSGSEANELALRLARTYTQRTDVVVLEHAYHGHTNTLIDISPYKFNGPGGRGQPDWVHVAPIADDYRGLYKRDDPARGDKYAAAVEPLLMHSARAGGGVAAFIAESAPSVAGQIMLPPGYLARVYRDVRAAGGICIADEVQTGFGRLGSHFWGFDMQQVIPDIVVLGKPIGNGFPFAAVVTTRAIADAFNNGMEFFSTFGGNPVACAAGLAVLDVLRDEDLQQNAGSVGEYLQRMLRGLQSRFALIGDVRGSGLFLGVELVRNRETLEPAAEEASYLVNRLRERGVLCGTDGPHDNVLKIRPPLCFTKADVDVFVAILAQVLEDDAVHVGSRAAN